MRSDTQTRKIDPMRKSIKILLIAVCIPVVLAAAYFIGGIVFLKTGMPGFMFSHEENDGGGVTITGYRGFYTKVSVPEKIGGLPVTDIGVCAFSSDLPTERKHREFNSRITEVRLPDTVEQISPFAFSNTAITEMDFPASLKYVGDYAFYATPLQSASLPEGTAVLDNNAFAGAYALETVTLPESLEKIGIGAFEKCYSLTQINIPAGLRSIGKGTFADTALDEAFIADIEAQFPGIKLK